MMRRRAVLGLAGVAASSRALCRDQDQTVVTNWSGTHEVSTWSYHEPADIPELIALVEQAHSRGTRIRPVGSALSPNGIGLSSEGMVNLVQCDKVLSVDPERKQITVQAGARVSQVVEALRPHGLTLQNYASIAEQQLGGFLQVGAHGTGASVPPVDQTVVSMKLVTPGRGLVSLSRTQEPELFAMAKVGLGALGVLAEVTLQCIPAERLEERLYVSTGAELREQRAELLSQNQHIRFMWIPHTDKVVVVACNPTHKPVTAPNTDARALEPLQQLLSTTAPGRATEGLNFAQLRDELLAVAPLDPAHVKAVNRAEAEFWAASAGTRVDWSDKVLGFECGGQQWVWENAFGVHAQEDFAVMEELLLKIERQNLPAPSPIEQRWSSGSDASMSTAPAGEAALHSWVGIIMYIPSEDIEQRAAIARSFANYCREVAGPVLQKYGARTHWAKIEQPVSQGEEVRRRLKEQFPVERFQAARRELDPRGVLGSAMLDELFGAVGEEGFVLVKQFAWQRS